MKKAETFSPVLPIENRAALIAMIKNAENSHEEGLNMPILTVECLCGLTHGWNRFEAIPEKNYFCPCGQCVIAYDEEN